MAHTDTVVSAKTKTIKVPGAPFKEQSPRLPWPRMSEPSIDKNGKELPSVPVGVCLKTKQQDIVKLVHKYFHVSEISMEDLIQEVYVAIAHKNHTPSAHNPLKSSFGHYVYMVANNVCINLVHKRKRYENEKESLDSPQGGDDSRTLLDTVAAPSTEESMDGSSEELIQFEARMRRIGLWEEARYLRAVRSGASPDVIREALSWGDRRISSKNIRDIREQVKEAFEEFGFFELVFR